MMNNLEYLLKILQDNKDELRKVYGVTRIGVFGSYVKQEQAKASDLDVLVEFQRAIDLLTFVNLKNHLSELLNIEVDLVMKKALKPKIGQRILAEVRYL